MLVMLVVLVWIGIRVNWARQNREREEANAKAAEEAVAAIEKLGGWFRSKHEERRPQTWLEALFDDPGDADDSVDVVTFTEAWLWGTDATDSDLQHLQRLPNLQALYLWESQITDAGLEHLKEMTYLKRLRITGNSNVTDAGLEQLKGLTNLQVLYVAETKITDAGLEHLKEMTELEHLFLSDTKVTDAGLEHLRELERLEELSLWDTKVTDEGVKKLQRALPNCEIRH